MICPNCGFDSPERYIHCGMCGTRLARSCPACQSTVPLGYRFCGYCGTPLGSTGNQEEYQEGPAVTSEIVTPFDAGEPFNSLPLDGEKRHVTVVVADVKASSSILEKIGSEAWVAGMNQVLQIMGNAVFQFGGEVDQFRGDGMVAFFGARSAHEDDPERAILAAMGIQERLKQFNQTFKQTHQQEVLVRVGINTGEVITARIGNRETHSEETAMGGAITLASRLESAAEPGTILLSQDTYELVADRFKWQPLGEIELRGLEHPVLVYRPLEPLLDSEQRHRMQAYGLSIPLVGRNDSFGTLMSAIQDLREHKGGILLISGEAGMGKSRLIFEARQQVNRDEALRTPQEGSLLWLQGRCRYYGHSLPHSMWVDLWQRWLGMGAWVSQEEASQQLKSQGRQVWGEQFEEHYPYMATFLSLPLEEAYQQPVKQLDAEGLRHRFFLAIYSWLENISKHHPLVLAFAEAHWADETSLDLLKFCLPLCTREQILFMVVYRPERTSPVWSFQHYAQTEYYHRLTTVELGPLDLEKSRQLLDEMIGSETLSPQVRRQILEKAAGNPYYLVELVHSLVEQNILVRDPTNHRWQVASQDIVLELPASLKSLLTARIDRLSAPEKVTLQMAAVIGPIFWSKVLQVLSGDNRDLESHLGAMQRAQLITERGLIPDLGREYAFSSSLIREAAYESILTSQREERHRLVAATLETIAQDQVFKHYHGIIAYHYRQAGDCQRDLFHSMLEAQNAQKIYANIEAIQAYRHVLDLLDREAASDCIPSEKLAAEWRLEALEGIGQIQFGIGQVAAAEEHLREAISLARRMNLEPQVLARLFYWMGEILFWQGRYEEPVHLGEEGLYYLGENNHNIEAALMNQLVAVGCSQLGDHQKFIQFTQRTAGFIQELAYSEELRPAYDHIIVLYAFTLKDLEGAQRWLDTFQELAENNHDLRALGEVNSLKATILTRRGDLDSAILPFRTAVDYFDRIGDAKHQSRVLRGLGACYLQRGSLEESVTCFDHALEASQVYENKTDQALGTWYKAQVLLCQGKAGEAQALFQKAYEISEKIDVLKDDWAFLGLGRVTMAHGKRQEIQDMLKFSLESNPNMVLRVPYQALNILSKLERTYERHADFQSYVEYFRQRYPHVLESPFTQWYLTPCEIDPVHAAPRLEGTFQAPLKRAWQWQDPFGDCQYYLDDGLAIHAANERNFHHINRSAPRFLVREPLQGDFTIQVTCSPCEDDRPTIGGLLVWQSDQYWFCFESGGRGPEEINLRGFRDNYDVVFGRGQLNSHTKLLRLERRGDRLTAYCSSDGDTWFCAGNAEIATPYPVQVGLHAIGHINRTIYPGAYPLGTAIRFNNFYLWEHNGQA